MSIAAVDTPAKEPGVPPAGTTRQVFACASSVTRLYGQAYDFPEYPAGAQSMEYMLAAVPRAGSTYLAMALWRTGVMGAPMEYPNPPFANVMRRRLGAEGHDLLSYWRAVKRLRTSPNGMFGYKMFVSDYLLG